MRPTRRDGFALALSLVAMVVIGALIAGAFWMSTQDFRTTRNAAVQDRALNAAEYGQTWVLANWNGPQARQMPLGDTVSWSPAVPGGGAARVRMTRLNTNTFWVVSEGRAATSGGQPDARRRTNLVLRLETPEIKVAGAVTSSGSFGMSGNQVTITANDANPSGWGDCPPPGASKPAIANDNPGSEVSLPSGSSCNSQSCLVTTHSPKLATDPVAGQADTYNNFGGISWDTLTAWAQAQYPSQVRSLSGTNVLSVQPSLSGLACNVTDPNNWGAPVRPSTTPACESFYPIVWLRGSGATTTINNVHGQGILLVEGNLRLTGSMAFYGLILVRGTFEMAGTGGSGAKVVGAVMAANTGNTMAGNSSIQYSSCAIAQALAAQNPPPTPAPVRSWADMY